MTSILLAITYCLYASLFLQAHLGTDQLQGQNSQTSDSIASLAADLFAKSAHSEQAFSSLLQEILTTLNNTKRNHWIAIKSGERCIVRSLLQYQRFSVEFIISFWKADIVFPFHQFW